MASLRSVGWMVLVAFLVRVLWIILAHTYRIRTSEDNWGFGWEIGRLGYSLANGQGFSSPFGGNTGPSAWTAPIYPWIVSVAFRLFGNYSRAAAFSAADVQQRFRRTHLLDDLSHGPPLIQRDRGCLVRLDLGVASLHHLLVGA